MDGQDAALPEGHLRKIVETLLAEPDEAK